MNAALTCDLAQRAQQDEIVTDVCVIGAGPVGLVVARALADRRHSVVLLERGPALATEQDVGAGITFDRREYRGATAGRAFGAGGTSALWGGQLLPLRESDLHERAQVQAPAWPIPLAELAPHYCMLEQWLCVADGPFALQAAGLQLHPLAHLQWGEWTPRLSKWIPFRRRNIYRAFVPSLVACSSIRIFLNATAREWHLRPVGSRQQITAATAFAANGRSVSVRARAYVICAGAIESARCVLEMNEAAGGLTNGVAALAGRFLHDHLSVRLARVRIVDRASFQRLFAPIFMAGTLRSVRMELSEEFLRNESLPALYAHFVINTPAGSGFALLRDLFRGLQQGKLFDWLAHAGQLPEALPGMAQVIFDRVARRRLSFPPDADVFLHCDFEQTPLRDNRIYLGTPHAGGYRPLHIDWDIGGGAARVASGVATAFKRLWTANDLERIAQLEFLDFPPDPLSDSGNLYDIYHPAGTTRMSADPMLGVVDENLLIYGTSNAFVAGSAVFPSIGSSNPTFTAMALGLRLAAYIDHELTAG